MPIKRQGVTYMKVSELSLVLGVHRNTIIYWIENNQVKAVRAGVAPKSPYAIPLDEVERIKEEMSSGV